MIIFWSVEYNFFLQIRIIYAYQGQTATLPPCISSSRPLNDNGYNVVYNMKYLKQRSIFLQNSCHIYKKKLIKPLPLDSMEDVFLGGVNPPWERSWALCQWRRWWWWEQARWPCWASNSIKFGSSSSQWDCGGGLNCPNWMQIECERRPDGQTGAPICAPYNQTFSKVETS